MPIRDQETSGCAWIGLAPSEWAVTPMKRCIEQRQGGSWGDETTDESSHKENVICIRIADFDFHHFKIDENANFTVRSYDKSTIKKLQLRPGDILIERSGGGEKTPVGRAVIFNGEMEALYSNFIERFRLKSEVDPKYFLYSWNSFYNLKHTRLYIKQTTGIQNLDIPNMIANEAILLPTKEEQRAIVDYLDDRCAEIDCLSSDIEKQIEIIREYQRSIINEAVTRGLNPNIEFKESGLEDVGRIPKHWTTHSFGWDFSFSRGLQITKADLVEEGIPCISYGEIHSKYTRFVNQLRDALPCVSEEYLQFNKKSLLNKWDFVFADTSEDIDGSGNFSCVEEDGPLFAGYHTVICRNTNSGLNGRFLAYMFDSSFFRKQIQKRVNGTKVFSITQTILKSLKFLAPPLEEQLLIANYLDQKCKDIDTILDLKNKQLETLSSYKQSLIYDFVTGKKAVPNDKN